MRQGVSLMPQIFRGCLLHVEAYVAPYASESRFCGLKGRGAKSAPPKKSMKELCQTPGCYIEV